MNCWGHWVPWDRMAPKMAPSIYLSHPTCSSYNVTDLLPPRGGVYILFPWTEGRERGEVTAPISGEGHMVKVMLSKFWRLGHSNDTASAIFPSPISEDNCPWDTDTILWGSPGNTERSRVGVLADSPIWALSWQWASSVCECTALRCFLPQPESSSWVPRHHEGEMDHLYYDLLEQLTHKSRKR